MNLLSLIKALLDRLVMSSSAGYPVFCIDFGETAEGVLLKVGGLGRRGKVLLYELLSKDGKLFTTLTQLTAEPAISDPDIRFGLRVTLVTEFGVTSGLSAGEVVLGVVEGLDKKEEAVGKWLASCKYEATRHAKSDKAAHVDYFTIDFYVTLTKVEPVNEALLSTDPKYVRRLEELPGTDSEFVPLELKEDLG